MQDSKPYVRMEGEKKKGRWQEYTKISTFQAFQPPSPPLPPHLTPFQTYSKRQLRNYYFLDPLQGF
jgi:hypothetical protein